MDEQETVTTREAPTKALGLDRWVQMTFLAIGVLLLWVLDKAITIIWDRFAEPEPLLVTAAAAVVASVLTYTFSRQPKVKRISHEIVGELAKVSWPSRQETQISTIVVIITSILAAAIVGAFDAAWAAITDLIYKV
jgi:preprotein translocase SecE subunit